jgi:glycosyltransferase involved in cell wall biosynthesis
VVSDNCSTDETPQILARYAARYPRMRVSRQARNVGAYPNILTTLHQARGEIVVSISDDDLMIPEQLLSYVQRMTDDPSLVMIQAPWLLVDETKGQRRHRQVLRLRGRVALRERPVRQLPGLRDPNHVFPECWLMRRDALPSIAGPTPRFTYSYFCMLAHALTRGAVLFSPEPHIAATAVAQGPTPCG